MESKEHLISVQINDFDLVPSKLSIVRVYVQHLAVIAQQQHKTTHEEIYYCIEEAHLKYFNEPIPFKSYDSFKKYLQRHKKEIYRKNAKNEPQTAPIYNSR